MKEMDRVMDKYVYLMQGIPSIHNVPISITLDSGYLIDVALLSLYMDLQTSVKIF